MHILAWAWLAVVAAVAVRFIVTYTDRYFWMGVGYGVILLAVAIGTISAIWVVMG
jgi:hypothetical protein